MFLGQSTHQFSISGFVLCRHMAHPLAHTPVQLHLTLVKARISRKSRRDTGETKGSRYVSNTVVAITTSIDTCGLGKSHGYTTTIDMLPDGVLLEIFDFYRTTGESVFGFIHILAISWASRWRWDRLVHVCRRWRQIVFASPHRLRIKLWCTSETPVRKHLSCWPAFPIIIDYAEGLFRGDKDNVVAALEHSNRICKLTLTVTAAQLAKLVTIMQEPYPALEYLALTSDFDAWVLPGGFLGGYVLCLRRLTLKSVPFPTLPALLTSASDLVELHRYDISKSGYISPEAMVAALTALSNL